MSDQSNKTQRQQLLNELCQVHENKFCFDCNKTPTQWVSINNGIFLCLECSTEHRNFGYNISFIKSTANTTSSGWYNTLIYNIPHLGMMLRFLYSKLVVTIV